MNSNANLATISKNMREFTEAFEKSELNKQLKEMEKATIRAQQIFKPHLDAMEKVAYNMRIIFSGIEDCIRPWKEWGEMNALISVQHLDWLKQISLFSEIKKENGHPLIEIRDREIIFNLKHTKFRKASSVHRLLLLALICISDESKFLSYDNIEKYFVENGLEPLLDKKKSRKRILDAKKDVFRLIGIPTSHQGISLIKIIEGQGLKLYNPKVIS